MSMPSVTGTGWVLRFLPTQAMLWFCDSMKWSLVFSFRLNWLVKQISVSLQHHVLQTQVLYSRCSTMFCWLLLPHLYLFSKPLHGFLTGAGRKYSIPSQEIKLTFVILSWLCHQARCCCHLTAFLDAVPWLAIWKLFWHQNQVHRLLQNCSHLIAVRCRQTAST